MSRRVAVWIFLTVVFVGIVVGIAVGASRAHVDGAATIDSKVPGYRGSTVQDGHGKRVAIVPIAGVIVDGSGSPGQNTIGGDDLVDVLDALDENDDVAGVILELNTPGGAVLASTEVSDRVRKMDTPVVAWMRESAASGGYYISSAADRIVAHPATITGSIGVILEYVNLAGLADKVGVEPVIVKSGKLKDMGSPFRDLTSEERRVLQAMIDEAYGDFVAAVANGRDMSESDVRTLADGRIYTGRQAKSNGLVDRLGGRSAAYREIARLVHDEADDLRVVRYEQHFDFWDYFAAARSGLGSPDMQRLVGDSLGLPAGAQGGTVRDFGGGLPHLEYRAVL